MTPGLLWDCFCQCVCLKLPDGWWWLKLEWDNQCHQKSVKKSHLFLGKAFFSSSSLMFGPVFLLVGLLNKIYISNSFACFAFFSFPLSVMPLQKNYMNLPPFLYMIPFGKWCDHVMKMFQNQMETCTKWVTEENMPFCTWDVHADFMYISHLWARPQ